MRTGACLFFIRLALVSLLLCACPGAGLAASPGAQADGQADAPAHSEGPATAGAASGNASNADQGISLRISATPLEATESAAAGAQPAGSSGSAFSFGGYFRALGILCLCVAALWFLLRFLRRYNKSFGQMRPGVDRNMLRMEAQLPLGPRRGLMVVRFEDERILVGVTEHGISHISSHSLDGEDIPAPTGKNFGSLFNSFSRAKSGTVSEPAVRPAGDGSAADGGSHV